MCALNVIAYTADAARYQCALFAVLLWFWHVCILSACL